MSAAPQQPQSEKMKANNHHFYYAFLEFKDRKEHDIYLRLGIGRRSIDTMSKNEIKQIIGLMIEELTTNL